ncbi:MAG: hypothetical protein A3H42_05195 [Deltaproteobacteria bacterium RIFCSPLOWO2_02_FULL_46_8]|nr:MAG: hypothetical protein A3H42_05195 [Deltaproteobacteria bacterium RIFCSPLOWO2_02_FULL_46_8]
MSTAHFVCENPVGPREGDIEALAVQDLKKGMAPEQFLSDPTLQHDGNFDLVVKDTEGNLKHIVVSNTDPGAQQLNKAYKTKPTKPITITIGQHSYRLLGMDDGSN